jgi:hypothetical protein
VDQHRATYECMIILVMETIGEESVGFEMGSLPESGNDENKLPDKEGLVFGSRGWKDERTDGTELMLHFLLCDRRRPAYISSFSRGVSV